MDALGTIGSLPKKIGDVTTSISKGANSLDTMVGKMDTAIKGVPTYNPVSGAIKGGLSKTTGGLKKGTSAINNAGRNIRTIGAHVSTALQPIGKAAQTVQQSLQDLKNCQEVMATSALVVNAVVDSCSGHFHPRVNEQVLTKFDGQWDSWAKTVNGIYQKVSPTGQANILESLAKGGFGDNVFYLGSAIKNESAGIFGGIADFEDALHAFEGSYRNPVEAAKKIETGVKNIVNATERVANSINNMVTTYQKGMGQNVTGIPVLSYIGNLHNTKAVSAVNKVLTVGGGAATLFSDGVGLQNALQSKDPHAIYSAGKKTIDDAKTIIKGLKNTDEAKKVTSLATGTSTGGAAPVDQTAAQQQQTPPDDNHDDSGNADSYVCSGATLKCTFGDRQSKLTVYPDRTVFLTDQPMANISDHTSLYNIAPFGKCHTTSFPPTGAATAAAHGKLTPMPCVPGTNSNWMNGKNDYIIKGDPALLKSSFCRCCYGGVITITDDGQKDTAKADMSMECRMIWDTPCDKKELSSGQAQPAPNVLEPSQRLEASSWAASSRKAASSPKPAASQYFRIVPGVGSLASFAKQKSYIDAQGVEVQEKFEYRCCIRKISCSYVSEEKQPIETVLYEKKQEAQSLSAKPNEKDENESSLGYLRGGVSNSLTERCFYFISNNKGKAISLSCLRENNLCVDESHSKYEIDYVDINDREIKSECREIGEGNLWLYYYDLFYRANDYARDLSGFMYDQSIDFEDKVIGYAGGFAVGYVAGNVADFIMAMRFILLPVIKDSDYKYESHAAIYYRECPQIPGVPSLIIRIYPDIEYHLELGFLQYERTAYGDKNTTDERKQTSFKVDFSIKYCGTERKIEFDNYKETSSEGMDKDAQKGFVFYKTLRDISGFLKKTSEMAEELKSSILGLPDVDNSLEKDIGSVSKTFDLLSKSPSWFKGTLEIAPSLILDWKYFVSDDLCELRKHLILQFGLSASGKLTIDLIEVYRTIKDKVKTTANVVAVGTAVTTGGTAALPAYLVNKLLNTVVEWLYKRVSDGIDFKVEFKVETKFNLIEFDSVSENHFDCATIELELSAKIIFNLNYKGSISFFVRIEYDLGASAEACTCISYKFDVNLNKKELTLDVTGELKPLTVKIERHVGGSFHIIAPKENPKKGLKNEVTQEWKIEKRDLKPMHWVIFDFDKS